MKKIFSSIICAMALFTACNTNIPEIPSDTFPTEQENNIKRETVDMGLSVKWATCNVGASKSEEYGDYFAWGETKPKSIYNWSTYKWCDDNGNILTRYNTNSNYGSVDKKNTLEPSDDAATVNWGGSWRTPTEDEWLELINHCTRQWTRQNNVYGYRITSKITGKTIFLPAAGCRLNDYFHKIDDACFYWSSSLLTNNPTNSWNMIFSISDEDWTFYSRFCGQSVRPVCP